MDKIIINNDGINNKSVVYSHYKCKAVIINSKNEILLKDYQNLYFLPGGFFQIKSSPKEKLITKLNQNIGVLLRPENLDLELIIDHYQKHYPHNKRGSVNKLLITYYYLALMDVDAKSANEDYQLTWTPINEIETLINNSCSKDPRKKFLDEELLCVTDYFVDCLELKKTPYTRKR